MSCPAASRVSSKERTGDAEICSAGLNLLYLKSFEDGFCLSRGPSGSLTILASDFLELAALRGYHAMCVFSNCWHAGIASAFLQTPPVQTSHERHRHLGMLWCSQISFVHAPLSAFAFFARTRSLPGSSA